MNKEKENKVLTSKQPITSFRGNNNWTSMSNGAITSSSQITTSSNLGKQTLSTSNLPPLKETNKFSSWTDKNLFD